MINGRYTIRIPFTNMFMNTVMEITQHNIITLLGESFFLNRAINDEFTPIQYICLGNSAIHPTKNDLALGNETIRKKCIKKVELDKNQIKLTCSFKASELAGACEIGTHNGDILISHDVFDEGLIDDLITPTVGDITIDYYINLSTGAIHNREWQTVTGKENIYYLIEPNEVVGVIENNTNSGYVRLNSIDELLNVKGSYFYDYNSKNLYVHTTQDSNPDNEELIILTR